MSSNDFVAMATHICPVCGIEHEHDTEILIHKHLRAIPKDKRCTGYGLCEEHDKLHKDGYIALIVVDNPESEQDTMKPEDADRTGDIAHMRYTAFNEIFSLNLDTNTPFAFLSKEAFNCVKSIPIEGESNA